jgi:L-ribulokinase
VREHVIGIDFGTDSARSVVVDARTGEVVGQGVSAYRRWSEGLFCDARSSTYRQHPLDHVESLEASVRAALAECPAGTSESVRGIALDATGSTPGAVDRAGKPLALLPGFEENPNAMFMMWKDHTAVGEADEINAAAGSWGGEDYTRYSGGSYSAEWFFSKILHVMREDGEVRGAAFSWVEHCDWLPALLTGKTDPLTLKRSRCAAGHKAMWNESFGGLPSERFLERVDPLLAGVRGRLYSETVTADNPAGALSTEWAGRLGLPGGVVVGTGAIDAHFGAVGAGIRPRVLTKVMGTSTCDMLVVPAEEAGGRLIRGICGQVDGSIVPGMTGMEAGQSAFGDLFAWFRDLLAWPAARLLPGPEPERAGLEGRVTDDILDALSAEAEVRFRGPAEVSAIDWVQGRRTPDADLTLRGVIAGIGLGSDAVDLFKALVDAAAFGARSIVERFATEGLAIDEVIALGGIARRAPLVMQTLADVLDMPVKVSASEQTCALGAAMFAATACGIYGDISEAQEAMGCGFDKVYRPAPDRVERYAAKYREYLRLGDLAEKWHRQ